LTCRHYGFLWLIVEEYISIVSSFIFLIAANVLAKLYQILCEHEIACEVWWITVVIISQKCFFGVILLYADMQRLLFRIWMFTALLLRCLRLYENICCLNLFNSKAGELA